MFDVSLAGVLEVPTKGHIKGAKVIFVYTKTANVYEWMDGRCQLVPIYASQCGTSFTFGNKHIQPIVTDRERVIVQGNNVIEVRRHLPGQIVESTLVTSF